MYYESLNNTTMRDPPTSPGATGCESLAGRLPLIPFILGFNRPDPPGGGLTNQAGAFSATGRSRTRSLSNLGRRFVDFDF